MAKAAALGVMVVVLVTCMVQEATADVERLRIGIRLSQSVDVPNWTMQQARDVVSAVYARAGVDIVWAVSPDRAAAVELTVILAAVAPASAVKSRDVLAVAIAPDTGCGRIAYAMWPRIQAFAHAHEVSAASVLGRVIAHEIGHLLLGQRAHSDHGIMKAGWNKRDFVAIGDWASFTPNQSAQLRQAIIEESGTVTWAVPGTN